MKILVTGANGFVGRALVNMLLGAGHEVHALDLKDAGFFTHTAIAMFYQQDIVLPFLLKEHFDVVIHLAAYNVTHVGDAAAEIYRRVNVSGTEHVIKAARAQKFVFLSTVKVYERVVGVIDEVGALAPAGYYEQSKVQAEEVCRRLLRREAVMILRSVNIIGPGQTEKAVIPVFFRKALSHEPIDVFGPRRQCLQLLDVHDASRALCAAAVARDVSGIFNIAPDEVIRLDELVARIRQMCSSRSPVVMRNDDHEDEVRFSAAKANDILQWRPQLTLEESLQRCLEYYATRT